MLQHRILQAIEQLDQIIIGKNEQITLAMSCLLAGGHLLIEDLPGMGKTTLSKGLARVLGLEFCRVQFTSDLLPADVLGMNMFDANKQQFTFHPGPVFTQVMLADEINRASPKTQSALLEAMEEFQVSIDGETRQLPSPFFVIATQNPMHQAGTYPLPESQLDRFLMRIELGYPDWRAEKQMLIQQQQDDQPISALLNAQDLCDIQQQVKQVKASEAIIEYVLNLVTISRQINGVTNPLSPRASKAILGCASSYAFIQGRDYIIPEDVQTIFSAVSEHRMTGSDIQAHATQSVSQKILEQVDPLDVKHAKTRF